MNKKIIFVVILVLIGIGVAFCCFWKKEEKETTTNTIEVVDRISGYNYQLEDRDTKLYKERFSKLKKNLESDEINYQEYARTIAELFIIDLYTIDNKISKYDIGALEFIYEEEKEKFQNKVMDTLYKLVEDNSNNTRKQELPVVKDVEIIASEESTYEINNRTFPSYKITATVSYEKDLGYDNNVIVTLVKEENKVVVVNFSVIDK